MQDKILNAQLRDERGKNSSYRLRQNDFIPAVLYSHGNCDTIKINKKEFTGLFKDAISESVIFTVKIEGKDDDHLAFVKDLQRNPRTGELIHVDLFKVTRGEKINTIVPLSIVGTAKGTKVGGVIEISKHEVEVECLPKDLPELIEVDISELDINDYIHARDIQVSDDIDIKTNPETVIVSVHAPRLAAVEEVEEEAEVIETEEKSDETSEE